MENAFLHIHGIACAYHIGAAKHAQQLQHLHCGMKSEHGSFPLHVWVCEELQCFPIVPNLPTRRCICRLDCMPDSSTFFVEAPNACAGHPTTKNLLVHPHPRQFPSFLLLQLSFCTRFLVQSTSMLPPLTLFSSAPHPHHPCLWMTSHPLEKKLP